MRIALVNMPFSSLQIPSIALHQLQRVIEEQLGSECQVDIHYLNHDFGARIGPDMYAWVSESLAGHTCGFGEWLFRTAAFPDCPDNTEEYFTRYAHHFGTDQIDQYRRRLEPARRDLPAILSDLIGKHDLADADVVGMTSMFFQNMPSFALARSLKESGSGAAVIMGGANCEGTMGIEIVNHVPWIDFVFSGHGLVSFPEFLRRMAGGDLDRLHEIDGVFSRRNSRSVSALAATEKPGRPGAAKPESQLRGVSWIAAERPLDQPLVLDYGTYLESYDTHFGDHRREEIELLFETSRGCWWGEKAHCTFCGLNGATMGFREMSVERARSTIQEMVDRYSDRVDRFASVDNIIPKSYVSDLLPGLKVPDHVTLFYEIKADLPREDLKTLARARVVEVQPGIESFATETLKLMRKGTQAFNNIRFLADCAAEGVKPVWNLLVGFPGESEGIYRRYREFLPKLAHLPPPSGVFPVRFDRFSPYFIQSDEFGLNLAPLDYHDLVYPFDTEVVANMAYYFRDRNIDAPYQRDLAEHLGPLRDIVMAWRERWNDSGKAPRLRLVQDDYGYLIEDSRRGGLVEHELEDEDVALLRATESPRPVSEVREQHGAAYDLLTELGLLFEERGRVMSVVFEGVRHQTDRKLDDLGEVKGRAEAAALGLSFD